MRFTSILILVMLLMSSVAQASPFEWKPKPTTGRWAEIKLWCHEDYAPNLDRMVACRVEQRVALGQLATLVKTLRPNMPEANIINRCVKEWWVQKPDAVATFECYQQRKKAWDRLATRYW